MKCNRKAIWFALCFVGLAAISCSAQDESTQADVASPTTELSNPVQRPAEAESNSDADSSIDHHAAEATRAYRQAMHTLAALSTHPSPYQALPTSTQQHNSNSKPILSSVLPNLQGPIGSAIRIVSRLQHQLLYVLLGSAKLAGARRKEEEMYHKAIKVTDLLQHSAELGNTDALYTLGHISLFPPTSHFPSDPKLAFDCFSSHISLTGNATSQAFLAFFFATGYKDVVPVDQARAQLYYTFAANGGDQGAQMALGYRYWSGIGTLEDCQRAVDWYEQAAEQAMQKFRSGPPGGLTLPLTPTRLSDLDGGIYGPGASVASTGLNAHRAAIKASLSKASGETWEDIMDYYMFNADRGETDFSYRLGKIYYQGSIYATPGGIASGSEGAAAIPRDYARAKHYFEQIARQVWPRDSLNPLQHRTAAPATKDEKAPFGYASASAAYLGRMYLRGEGVRQDMLLARMWFERGADFGERECHNGLGILWRDGLVPGTKPDIKKALQHFNLAAGQELAEAQVNLAKYHFARREITLATTFFDTAVRLGSPFEAFYYLGRIQSSTSRGLSVAPNVAQGSCAMAVSFYKLVSERGVWGDDLLRDAEYAWTSGSDRGKEVAMLKWWIAAERGSEIAQNNLAYILDQDKSILRLTRFSPFTPSNDTAQLALTQWTRAAAQKNIDALVKVGDYYYHNLGVPESPASVRLEKAARYYQSAADTQMSALAMWNLGWMYENGIGVPQDFHLAKRQYDLALETNSEAYIPIVLSLAKLYARSIWHTLMGGKGGLNIWTDDEPPPTNKHDEVPRLEEAAPVKDAAQQDYNYNDDEGDSWYFGKARDEFHRRRGVQVPDRDEDPVQWARDRRNSDADRDSVDYSPEDYYDNALRTGGEDEFTETVLLMVLCLTVAALIYVRTRMVDRMRRQERERRQRAEVEPQPNGGNGANPNGLFPRAGDAARDEWAIVR